MNSQLDRDQLAREDRMHFEAGRRPVGTWSWNVVTDEWVWDDTIFRLQGYEQRGASPSTALLIANTFEPDRPGIERVLTNLRSKPEPFGAANRIRPAPGKILPVVIIGQRSHGRDDVLSGWLTPVADPYDSDDDPGIAAARLAEQVENLQLALAGRDTIGQAKGLLRAHLGLDDAAAFEMLRQLSQNTNTRLGVVADRLVQYTSTRLTVTDDDRQRFTREVLDLLG